MNYFPGVIHAEHITHVEIAIRELALELGLGVARVVLLISVEVNVVMTARPIGEDD